MATRPTAALPEGTLTVITAGALGSALLIGGLMTRSVPAGLGALIAVCYVPLVLINLRLGLALWLPLAFLEGLSMFNAGGKAAGLIVAIGWVGLWTSIRPSLATLVGRHRAVVVLLCGSLLWSTLSVAWAASPHAAAADLWHWYAVALIWLIVATVVRDPKTLRLILHMFVVGAVLSVLAGLIYGSGSASTDLLASESGRFYGAEGDPNILAAGLLPAIILAIALGGTARNAAVRAWLVVAGAILVYGVVASQSRGGIVASGVAVVAALVVFNRRRAQILAISLVVVGLAGAWLSSTPGAFHRITTFQDGSGRTDIWHVALRVGEAHPIGGAGLDNFQEVSAHYVRQPGPLKALGLIVDSPHVAHNLYLETFAGLGIVGVILLLGFMGACLMAAWSAARRFQRMGDDMLDTLARAVLVAGISFLAAAVFISAGVDKRLWVLLALGPALNAMAIARERGLRI